MDALFLILFLIRSAAAYNLPNNYFINCGSDSSVILFGQTYSPDLPSFSIGPTTALQTSNLSATPLLYKTARLFTTPSSYQLPIIQTSTLILRLHFHPFSSDNLSLSNAKFHVSIFKTTLLSNVSIAPGTTLIEEFLVPINPQNSWLTLDFTPAEGSGLAFLNAIEAFPAPPTLLRSSPPLITSNFLNLNHTLLRKVHRINMGGGALTPKNDTLNRHWDADDTYLRIPDSAKNTNLLSKKPLYNTTLSDKFIAPDLVYQTSKELNPSSARLANSFNATWNFPVLENTRHFIRAHFCNIVGDSSDDIWFKFFIDGYFGMEIVPWKIAYELNVPFYVDFVVESDHSGVLNISIGYVKKSRRRTAFLNGLEIMEVMDGGSRFRSGGASTGWRTILAVVGGVLVLVILIVGLIFVLHRRKMKWAEKGGSGSEGIGSELPLLNFNLGLRIPIREIIRATNNFDASLMIGEGGFGKVYKGALQDGTKVAIKRSEPGHGQGLPEFHTEIMILSKIRHVHLVSLIGYCDENSEMILVYELMENGTLREHLYEDLENSSSQRAKLSWEKRLEICIGAAKGLHYLHTGAVGGIIHRDVKSTNILLDGNFKAKVADFGLSSVLLDQSHVSTDVKGSFGYLDPEYFRTMQLTQKSDVYSFGVVLLEIACARPVIKNSERHEETSLAEWGLLWHEKGQLEEIIDTFLLGKIDANSLRVFGDTAAKCLKDDGADRPTMGEVIWGLEYALQLQNIAAPSEGGEFSTTMSRGTSAFPCVSSCNEKLDEEVSVMFSDHSETSASHIFSQLRIDGAR